MWRREAKTSLYFLPALPPHGQRACLFVWRITRDILSRTTSFQLGALSSCKPTMGVLDVLVQATKQFSSTILPPPLPSASGSLLTIRFRNNGWREKSLPFRVSIKVPALLLNTRARGPVLFGRAEAVGFSRIKQINKSHPTE